MPNFFFFLIITHKRAVSMVHNTWDIWNWQGKGIWGSMWRYSFYLVPKKKDILNNMKYLEQSSTKKQNYPAQNVKSIFVQSYLPITRIPYILSHPILITNISGSGIKFSRCVYYYCFKASTFGIQTSF